MWMQKYVTESFFEFAHSDLDVEDVAVGFGLAHQASQRGQRPNLAAEVTSCGGAAGCEAWLFS